MTTPRFAQLHSLKMTNYSAPFSHHLKKHARNGDIFVSRAKFLTKSTTNPQKPISKFITKFTQNSTPNFSPINYTYTIFR